MTKRLFIGIPIQSATVFMATETWKTDEQLKRNVLKWVNPENWHITLVFLGNTPESEIRLLQEQIDLTFSGVPAFKANLMGLGVFPNSNKPKVLWLGIESIQVLMPVQARLVGLLQQYGFSLENKPLKPHLTLARIKNAAHRDSIDSLIGQNQNKVFGSVEIDRVILYESISTPSGPVYQPVHVHFLSETR